MISVSALSVVAFSMNNLGSTGKLYPFFLLDGPLRIFMSKNVWFRDYEIHFSFKTYILNAFF